MCIRDRLTTDKEAVRRKYENIVVDNATLDDVMLFIVKGERK